MKIAGNFHIAPAFDLKTAPPEIREAMRRVQAEVDQFKLKAPDDATLKQILDAGAGEHRDRLFNKAVEVAFNDFIDEINTTTRRYIEAYHANKRTEDAKGNEKYFS